jgi:hypothetical protein
VRTTSDLAEVRENSDFIWLEDPADVALQGSSDSRKTPNKTPPMNLCLELGRRLLLAELQFSDWILRRVESVRFEHERSVSRAVSVEFVVRDDAPIFVTRDGRRQYLVPLSMMRRRTLVNFKMADESGRPLPMFGMRMTQQLDASMLFAAAATESPTVANHKRVRKLIDKVIAGEADEVKRAYRSFRTSPPAPLCCLAGDTLFAEALNRLRWNFSLYVGLDVEKGRHRILNLTFDELTSWRLQQSDIIPDPEGSGEWRYRPGQRVPALKHFTLHMLAKFGIRPTRFRFQIPGAENAASYHFEALAPLGVRIVMATLLAGRPHESGRRPSFDRIVGHRASVGLHAVEIPNNSLCRVQLDLRVPSRGWLTQLVVSCGLIFLILASVYFLWPMGLSTLTPEQLTNVVVILVSASAATATLIAQRQFHGLPAFMVTYLRAIGVASLLLPIVAAGYFVYESRSEIAKQHLQSVMGILTMTAAILFVVPFLAFVLSWRSERLGRAEGSPWDMTIPDETEFHPTVVYHRSAKPDTYEEGLRQHKFCSPAIGIQAAEGWHERYHWTDPDQQNAKGKLDDLRAILDPREGQDYREFLRCINCNVARRCINLAQRRESERQISAQHH